MIDLFTNKQAKLGIGILSYIVLFTIGYFLLINGIPVLSNFAFLTAGIVTLVATFGKESIKKVFAPLAGNKKILRLLFYYILSFVVAAVALQIIKLLGGNLATNPIVERANPLTFVGMIPMLIGEELFTVCALLLTAGIVFRIGGNKTMALIIGCIISTLFFAALHIPTYQGNVLQAIIGIGSIRVVFTIAMLRFNSLTASSTIHIAYDWTAILFSLFS